MGKNLMRVLIAAALASALLSCDFGSGASYPEVDTYVKDYYTTGYNSYPVTVDVADNRVLMGGTRYPAADRNNSSSWLVMTDLNGDLLWQRLINVTSAWSSTAITPSTMTLVPDGGALVGLTDANGVFVIAKFSDSGTLLWDRYYNDANFTLNAIQKLEVLDNGDIRLLGDTQSKYTVIALFDSTGTYKWSVIAAGVYHDLQEIPGGMVLTGMDAYEGPSYGDTSLATILNTDTAGKPTSTRQHGGLYNTEGSASSEINSLTDAATGPDGSVYAVGTSLEVNDQIQGMLVMKISAEGNILWRKFYRTRWNGVIEMNTGNSIAVGLDGYIHIAGRAIVTNPDDMNDSWEDVVHLQIDSSGKVLRGRRYGEKFRAIEIVESFKDSRLPGLGGNEEMGWFISGVHGTDDGYMGNTRLYRVDGALDAAGMGTAFGASDVKVDDFTDTMYRRNMDDEPLDVNHILNEVFNGETYVANEDTTLIQVSQAAP